VNDRKVILLPKARLPVGHHHQGYFTRFVSLQPFGRDVGLPGSQAPGAACACRRMPNARATFRIVAKLGLPSPDKAL
jgi:hypothetical protein